MQNSISRRQWLKGAAGLVILSCSQSETVAVAPAVLGPAENFPEGDTEFSVLRVLLRRRGNEFSAMSLVCTHQTCLLVKKSGGFSCPCHGSQFSDSGAVTAGPATKNLPYYELSLSPAKEILVHLSKTVPPDRRLTLQPR